MTWPTERINISCSKSLSEVAAIFLILLSCKPNIILVFHKPYILSMLNVLSMCEQRPIFLHLQRKRCWIQINVFITHLWESLNESSLALLVQHPDLIVFGCRNRKFFTDQKHLEDSFCLILFSWRSSRCQISHTTACPTCPWETSSQLSCRNLTSLP